jgi:hypothetical protein
MWCDSIGGAPVTEAEAERLELDRHAAEVEYLLARRVVRINLPQSTTDASAPCAHDACLAELSADEERVVVYECLRALRIHADNAAAYANSIVWDLRAARRDLWFKRSRAEAQR